MGGDGDECACGCVSMYAGANGGIGADDAGNIWCWERWSWCEGGS